MRRPITIVGAPSSIGIRPYDDGNMRRLDLAPAALRGEGLVTRIAARDSGDVSAPTYRDFVRPPKNRPRNEDAVASYSRRLADRIASASADGSFVLVLGGDCSIVLGCLLGLRRPGAARVGLEAEEGRGGARFAPASGHPGRRTRRDEGEERLLVAGRLRQHGAALDRRVAGELESDAGRLCAGLLAGPAADAGGAESREREQD